MLPYSLFFSLKKRKENQNKVKFDSKKLFFFSVMYYFFLILWGLVISDQIHWLMSLQDGDLYQEKSEVKWKKKEEDVLSKYRWRMRESEVREYWLTVIIIRLVLCACLFKARGLNWLIRVHCKRVIVRELLIIVVLVR